MTIAKNFLLAYLLLKPFYLFGSGGLQIADLFLLLSFATLIFTIKINKNARQELIENIKSNKLFIIFVAATFIVNIAYFSFYGEFKFILSTLYFVFNLLAIITFSSLYKDKVFLERVSKVFKISLLMQLAIFIVGIGRYYTPDRYMGTFNDPNQLGYYIFLSFLFIYVIKILLGKKENNLLYLLIALFLIIQCASTGMLLGVATFLVLIGIYHLRDYIRITYEKLRKTIYISLTAIIATLVLLAVSSLLFFNNERNIIEYFYENQTVIDRVTEKTEKASGEADISLLEDRGYDIIFKYPQYVLFGAGEGGFGRFDLATNNHGSEIHATLPSILFYYGIIPFLILLRWIYLRIKDFDPRILIVFAALFIESFTLLNQRQALFWMIIILGSLSVYKITTRERISVKEYKYA